MTQRVEGIQNVVLKLIQYNGKIERKEILDEMVGLCKEDITKVKPQVDQALYWLKKKDLVMSDGSGTYQPNGECERCSISFVCSAITTKNGRSGYCPVRNVFICDPKSQCGVLFDFDYSEMKRVVIPKRKCYFAHKPSDLEIEQMKKMRREI